VTRRLNFKEELHYSAITKYDSLSGPGEKMGPWLRRDRNGKGKKGGSN